LFLRFVIPAMTSDSGTLWLPVLAIALSACAAAHSQEAPAVTTVIQTTPDGATVVVPAAGAPAPAVQAEPGKPPERRESTPPKSEAKPGSEPGKPEGEKKEDGKKPESEPKIVSRPEKPDTPPNPAELQLLPGKDGLIRFNFRGQSWPDVLDWLARVSGRSLDWQELPGDYLNLTTQRGYTVDEAKDLINRHLLARGFTMLENGEILSVVNIAKLNPGMVPRVEPDELAAKLPYSFVKVSFPLDWLMASVAVEELQPMLSPNGKLRSLDTTNRLEAMDAVINLRELSELLRHEQSPVGQERLVKEFPLQYAKANDVVTQLETLLGVEKKSSRGAMPMNPQQMEMMQQQARMMAEMQQQQMQQQMQQQRAARQPAGPAKEQPVNLVVNTRKNSILVHAPPDKMAIIEQAIKAIDVPSDRSDSLLTNPSRMQVYRLHAIDPDPLVRTLQEIGELSPGTRLEVDSKNNALIAYATLADHVVIRQLVERLDGSGRRFEVLTLRRLAADYVAGTIDFMMTGQKQEEQEQPRYFDPWSYRNRRDEPPRDTFRVDADVENNRLLLYANEIEIEEVTNLLVKLGELPPEGGDPSTVRVLEAIPADGAGQFFERLRRAWPSLAPNPLQLPDTPDSIPQKEDGQPPAVAPPPASPSDRKAGQTIRSAALFETAWRSPAEETPTREPRPADPPLDELPAETSAAPQAAPPNVTPSRPEPPPAEPSAAPAPVTMTIGPDGRLVISSQDAAALDVLQELVTQLAPPPADYAVFKLKYADSYWVTKNLEEFFKEEEDTKRQRSPYIFYYDYPPPQKSDAKNRLSKRKKLRFIDDMDTNSILVQGADAQQLTTIEELIKVYDQPVPSDAQTARVSAVVAIRYSKAETVAEAVKEVYRDLLSSNDKSLAAGPDQRNRPENRTTYIFNEGGEGAEPERTQVTFKGKLSIGVDNVTNTLLVSTEGENLLKNVTEMIKTLDEAAKPLSSVSVVPLSGAVNADRVRKVLGAVLGAENVAGGSAGSSAEKPPETPGQHRESNRNGSRSPGRRD
jgi:type II secretory pathway component GspD/PulD (secretin)